MPEDKPDKPSRSNRPTGPARPTRKSGPASFSLPPLPLKSPMAHAIVGAISGMESALKVRESLAMAYWPRVVGPQAANASMAESVRDGVLVVRTRSSVWSHELTLYKPKILQGINTLLGGPIIRDIVYRARGIKRKEEPKEPDHPSPEQLVAVHLDAPEAAELQARIRRLSDVSNEHARAAVETRLTREAKLRHWRLERGWKVCPRCLATHMTTYTLCPICRIGG